MPPKITLVYFNGKGRAEPVRLALHVAGIEFEDKRIAGEEWPALKADQPFGGLPALVVDGETYADSNAQLHYVGQLGGLYPKDPLAALLVDGIMGACEDLMHAGTASFFEKDQEKKLEMRATYTKEKIVPWLHNMAKFLAKHGKGYIVGDSLTVADLKLHVMLASIGWLDGVPKEVVELEEFPTLRALRDLVAGNAKVAEWNAMEH